MGKTRDLFKKIRDTKGTFHAKIDTYIISRQDRSLMVCSVQSGSIRVGFLKEVILD